MSTNKEFIGRHSHTFDTLENFNTKAPVLESGELVVMKDGSNLYFKVGSEKTAWASLPKYEFLKSYTTGSVNGTISINGTDIAVKGLGSAAYKNIDEILSGNSSTATKLKTARTIALTGSVTGSGTFDGSDNLTITTTTNHTHLYAGSSSAGGSATSAVKLTTSAGTATQPVYFSDGKPVACTYTLGKSVPSDAVFSYSPGTGLTLSGTTFNHKNSVTAGTAQGDASKTLTFGGTFTIPTVTYDAQGHVTGKGTTTMTMPGNPNTWRGIQDNLTSTSITDSLSANQGRLLANGSARDNTKLPLAGGTMTGSLNFANNVWNAVGDDVAIGDHNTGGSLGVKGLNDTPKISFVNSSNTVLSSIGSDTSGEVYSANNFNVKGTSMKLNNGLASIVYNSTTESIDFVFA